MSSLADSDDVLGRVLEALGMEVFARLGVDSVYGLCKASSSILMDEMLHMFGVNRREEVSRFGGRFHSGRWRRKKGTGGRLKRGGAKSAFKDFGRSVQAPVYALSCIVSTKQATEVLEQVFKRA